MKIIYIHGRDQQGKDPVKLKEEWDNALRKGLKAAGLQWPAGATTHLPFYGDTLIDLVEQYDKDPASGLAARSGGAPTDDELHFRSEMLEEIAALNGISDQEIANTSGVSLSEKGPLNWSWVQGILKALDKTKLGGKAINAFTHDVYLYLTVPGIRRRIDAFIAENLPKETCLVVSHSLGTVVAYNVLRNAAAPTASPRFITLGSPLGLRAVKTQLAKPLRMPPNTNAWHNAYDDGDVVALQPLDRNNFDIDPAIVNHGKVKNHTDNQHGISGYLDDPLVAKWIHEAATS
ncbi:MAG: hypothetical protein WAT74_06380 [Flavobacteriales bacterium]